MYIRVSQGESDEWHIQLIAEGNSEILMHSENYDSKANALRAAYDIQNDWPVNIEVLVRND